ncbi:PTS system galactitol-specific IIA component [Geomicrobium halophilum]|uniref:PTS system galactitol-specific IIA component n=1 Tax=Geomicrobium halophilum TaxID=549000 RepID=A0A841PZL2_9BACL|nr:PTS sugar transporter subunit IIA [Geomicrobium halophilum]MBB6449935.1 PTS system galactitol-specific IIA component [Geomicrobium halophilum]
MSDIYFDESIILFDLEGKSKEEVLTKIGNNLIEKNLVKEGFIDAIIKRESEYATGLPTKGVSVAIPHTDVEYVNRKTISVAVLKEPVDFGIMGEPKATIPIKLVFLLAMDEEHSQLSLLQKLMEMFQDEDTLKYLINENNKTKIKNLLESKLAFAFEGEE